VPSDDVWVRHSERELAAVEEGRGSNCSA
jgi:hypothetical protein